MKNPLTPAGIEPATLGIATAVPGSSRYPFFYFLIIIFTKTCFCETCQWLKFPMNGLLAQSRVSPAVGLLTLPSGPTCLGMEFPPFMMKQLYCCDAVVISSFVRTGYATRR